MMPFQLQLETFTSEADLQELISQPVQHLETLGLVFGLEQLLESRFFRAVGTFPSMVHRPLTTAYTCCMVPQLKQLMGLFQLSEEPQTLLLTHCESRVLLVTP
jgi:hypothetical protein